MTQVHRIIAVAALALVATSVFAQNPFQQSSRPPQQELSRGPAPQFLRTWSRSLQQGIAGLSQDVVGGRWTSIVPAFLLAVVFGVVHIAGPGHGKVFAISYFAGREATARHGLIYSAVVNIVDSVSAFMLVILGYLVLRTVLPEFRTDGPWILELVSYGMIVVFGVVHLVSHLRPHRHGHDDDCTAHPRPDRPPWLLGLSVGLVPCPVSTILLVYGVANGVLPFMITMVVGVTVGGFFTMSLLSLAVIYGRAGLLVRLRAQAARTIGSVLEYSASAAIIVAGLLLLLSRL
jgi:nickel/cobalt transporter (NicO) family protein